MNRNEENDSQVGNGYYPGVGQNDIGGQREIISYDDANPPIFVGELLQNGGKYMKLNKKNLNYVLNTLLELKFIDNYFKNQILTSFQKGGNPFGQNEDAPAPAPAPEISLEGDEARNIVRAATEATEHLAGRIPRDDRNGQMIVRKTGQAMEVFHAITSGAGQALLSHPDTEIRNRVAEMALQALEQDLALRQALIDNTIADSKHRREQEALNAQHRRQLQKDQLAHQQMLAEKQLEADVKNEEKEREMRTKLANKLIEEGTRGSRYRIFVNKCLGLAIALSGVAMAYAAHEFPDPLQAFFQDILLALDKGFLPDQETLQSNFSECGWMRAWLCQTIHMLVSLLFIISSNISVVFKLLIELLMKLVSAGSIAAGAAIIIIGVCAAFLIMKIERSQFKFGFVPGTPIPYRVEMDDGIAENAAPQVITAVADGVLNNSSKQDKKLSSTKNLPKISNVSLEQPITDSSVVRPAIKDVNQQGGNYNTIVNPKTNRKVSIHSNLGKKIIQNYINTMIRW